MIHSRSMLPTNSTNGSTISVQLTSWWHGSAYVQICNTIYHIPFKYITYLSFFFFCYIYILHIDIYIYHSFFFLWRGGTRLYNSCISSLLFHCFVLSLTFPRFLSNSASRIALRLLNKSRVSNIFFFFFFFFFALREKERKNNFLSTSFYLRLA